MVTVTGIEKAFGGRICRYCINSRYGMKLERKDCRYEKYSDICPSCGEWRHIVKRLIPVGYFRGIGKKLPPDGNGPRSDGHAGSFPAEGNWGEG